MISDLFCAIRDVLKELPKEYEFNYNQVELFDKEKCNIQHKIEFSKGCAERNKLATQFKTLLNNRRLAKNNTAVLSPIIDFLAKDQYKNLINDLDALIGRLRKEETHVDTAEYKPRDTSNLDIPSVKSLNNLMRQYKKQRKEKFR